MRIISIPNIGMMLMTIIESRTVCIVTFAVNRSSFIVTVARAFCIRQVCQVGSLTSEG
jgi:hypothetical protein